jgi:hypothetical protein
MLMEIAWPAGGRGKKKARRAAGLSSVGDAIADH